MPTVTPTPRLFRGPFAAIELVGKVEPHPAVAAETV